MILTRKHAREITHAIHEVLQAEQRLGGLGKHIGPSLDGACMIASALATLVLKKEHIQAGSIGGFFSPRRGARGRVHWWAETACGWILDPTASQFGKRLAPIATRLRTRHDSVYGLHKLFYLGGDDLFERPVRSAGYERGMVVTIKKLGHFHSKRGFIVGEEDAGQFLVELEGQSLSTGYTIILLASGEFDIDVSERSWKLWLPRCRNDISFLADAFFRMAYRLGISEPRARAELGWKTQEFRSLAA